MAPAVFVETPGCGAAGAEPWTVSHSRWTGCLIGCRPRCFPSWSPCPPAGVEAVLKICCETLAAVKNQQQKQQHLSDC